jgi:pimeloyl-ACP methyl ester carboxylesterase
MEAPVLPELRPLRDGGEPFDVTVLGAGPAARRAVLFAAGRSGNPARHLPLLQSLAARGCAVIAPHFDMIASTIPTQAELAARVRRAEASVAAFCIAGQSLAGIGHSLGTVVLLTLAGGRAQTFAGGLVTAGSRIEFDRLALLAPPTGFFRHPGALASVRVPIRVRVGAMDSITPPAQARFLQEALKEQVPIDILLDEEAGHFTYMDELPPHGSDSHPDRRGFLAALADDVGQFVMAPQGGR